MENNRKGKNELETVDRERSERKVRKERTKKTMTMITKANLNTDDRDAKKTTSKCAQ